MRTRPILAATVAALFLSACAATSSTPLNGTVLSKEYEPEKTKIKKVKIKEKRCKTVRRRPTCRKVVTGTKTITTVVEKECYQLTILTDGEHGDVEEICDKDAYDALEPEDRYSSSIDYSQETYQ